MPHSVSPATTTARAAWFRRRSARVPCSRLTFDMVDIASLPPWIAPGGRLQPGSGHGSSVEERSVSTDVSRAVSGTVAPAGTASPVAATAPPMPAAANLRRKPGATQRDTATAVCPTTPRAPLSATAVTERPSQRVVGRASAAQPKPMMRSGLTLESTPSFHMMEHAATSQRDNANVRHRELAAMPRARRGAARRALEGTEAEPTR